jgi:hypothetical protein
MLTATRPVERNPIMTDTAQAPTSDTAFDPTVALGDLLADVGLSVAGAGRPSDIRRAGPDHCGPSPTRRGYRYPDDGQRNCCSGDASQPRGTRAAADLFVTMQLHNVSDLDPVIRRLSADHPGVAVLDTRVVLRSVKSWGRLLGLDGRAQHVVPVDLWAPVAKGDGGDSDF